MIDPAISVVIAVRNGMPFLEDQLGALAAQRTQRRWELVVADNGSTDASAEVARSWLALEGDVPVTVVDASARRGPAAARNEGVRHSSATLLCFCDADDVVEPGWLEALSRSLADTDVVAGSFEMGSLNGGPRTEPSPAVTRQLGQIPAGLAANLGVRRSAFEQVGGFDEDLEVGEDIDLCWRLQLAGFTFSLAPAAVVAKRDRSTPGQAFRQGIAHGKSGPGLYKRHRKSGIRPDLRVAATSWAWLLVNAFRIYRPDWRTRWSRVAGVRIGRILGSIENRVFFP
ncbi:MAG: glycosyltransferase [Acidimicrobiales bacterium]